MRKTEKKTQVPLTSDESQLDINGVGIPEEIELAPLNRGSYNK